MYTVNIQTVQSAFTHIKHHKTTSQGLRQFRFVETCILKCTLCSVESWRKDSCVFQVYVLKRPHVDEFLKRMGELFECVLFTASLAKVRNISRPSEVATLQVLINIMTYKDDKVSVEQPVIKSYTAE